MEADERKQIRASATHRHHERPEERVKFPAQGLMGQGAGSSLKLTREMREKEERRVWSSAASASPSWTLLATAGDAG